VAQFLAVLPLLVLMHPIGGKVIVDILLLFQTGQPTSLGVSASWVRYFAGTYDVPKGADASVLAALSEALHQYQLALYAFRLQELASAESGHVGCVLTCDDASCRVLCTRAMFRGSPMTPACDTIFSLHPPPMLSPSCPLLLPAAAVGSHPSPLPRPSSWSTPPSSLCSGTKMYPPTLGCSTTQ
jgi:hypothetical protein